MNIEEQETTQVEEAQARNTAPRGREGVLAMWYKNNPEAKREPSEDELWNLAQHNFETKNGQRRSLVEGNAGLAELVQREPRFGAALGMSMGEDKIPMNAALGRVYGKDALNDDEDYLKGVEEYNTAQAKSQAEAKQASENFAESMKRFDDFVISNKLDDTQKEALYDELMNLAEGFVEGNLSDGIFEFLLKGMNYEKDVEEAIATGEVEGRNQKIQAKVKKQNMLNSDIVDMGAGTGGGKEKRREMMSEKPSSFADMLEDVK